MAFVIAGGDLELVPLAQIHAGSKGNESRTRLAMVTGFLSMAYKLLGLEVGIDQVRHAALWLLRKTGLADKNTSSVRAALKHAFKRLFGLKTETNDKIGENVAKAIRLRIRKNITKCFELANSNDKDKADEINALVKKSSKTWEECMTMAATTNDAKAALNLGEYYVEIRKYKEASIWFKNASVYGDLNVVIRALSALKNLYIRDDTGLDIGIEETKNVVSNLYFNAGVRFEHAKRIQDAVECFIESAKLGSMRTVRKLMTLYESDIEEPIKQMGLTRLEEAIKHGDEDIVTNARSVLNVLNNMERK